VSPGRAAGRLDGYRKRRDFRQTAEPAGEPVDDRGGAGAPGAQRFVVHEHSARRLHWDLRLERDGVLVSWALPRGMPLEPKVNLIAPHTEDHPLAYLDFEGEIPAGNYGAGTMSVWDRGTYECLKWERRKVEVALHGERLQARYALFAISDEAEPKEWMIHRMDAASDADAEPMPEHIVPMLARAGVPPQDDGNWAYEVKWDGVRALVYSEPGRLRIEGRSLIVITARYPELAGIGRALRSHRAVLDGEIVAFDAAGRPSFGALGQRMQVGSDAAAKRLARTAPVTYVIFDLLWLDGHSLMARSYSERRAALTALALDGERWQTPPQLAGRASEVLEASRASGLEGVLAKRLDSPYRPGRRDGGWIKLTNVNRGEFVVGGWTAGSGQRSKQIGALLLGSHDDSGALRYSGRVGSGFSEHDLEQLASMLAPLERRDSPFAPGTPGPPRSAVFCEPKLVVEVEFREWTAKGMLRAPSFKGLREDKPAHTVGREDADGEHDRPEDGAAGAMRLGLGGQRARGRAPVQVAGRELTLSNLDKVLYPATSLRKGDVIDYYATVAPAILPHLRDRPLTVKRFPDGVEGKAFFEKQSPAHRPPWVRTVAIASERRTEVSYTVADDLPTLVWLANLAALELHTPLARIDDLEHPTAVVFDLDPGPPATIIDCCRVALWLQGTFDQLGLESFAKTSGSKGLQVYLPLGATAGFEQTKRFAHSVATLLERAQPELVVSRMTRALRPGKVLIDWSQNDPHKTTVCVYSLRAAERPTVSTPLRWAELELALESGDPHSLSFESDDVLARVARDGDLFAPVLSLVQALPAI
jgi:bifunctional non-homologous end joining protein LigD